jgi:hypothetical protein
VIVGGVITNQPLTDGTTGTALTEPNAPPGLLAASPLAGGTRSTDT